MVTSAVAYGCVWNLQDHPRWGMGLLDFLLLLIVNCLSPYIGMSSVSDYKVRGWVRVGGAWRVGGEGEMILSGFSKLEFYCLRQENVYT